jgi:hypothetical protein
MRVAFMQAAAKTPRAAILLESCVTVHEPRLVSFLFSRI